MSLTNNTELLYPIFPTVMMAVYAVFDELEPEVQDKVLRNIRSLINEGSHVVHVDLNIAYAIRVLGRKQSPENEEILPRLFKERTSVIVRRDIILIMSKWNAWYWISDLRSDFRTLGSAERRAFIIASYVLGDEGRHWRQHLKKEFSPFELQIREWASSKSKDTGWSIPI